MTMSENGHLLKVEDLHVVREGREILRGVDMAVAHGSIHAVLGLNGSGKSTLAYALMGNAGYTPSQGRILFKGQDITSLNISERGKLGMTLAWQEPARFEGLTVARYLALGMRDYDITRVIEALDAVALGSTYLTRMVDESLSGGERKRLELAAVWAMQPALAILDEPDSGIDTLSLDEIAQVIHRMALEGTTVLLISHRDEVVAIADTASLICEGRVLATGEVGAVCERYVCCCEPCERAERVEADTEYGRF